jgi:aspartyl-tRNA(Asn)/glutamyl-tRNA(Gln) amidotransferase subunit C
VAGSPAVSVSFDDVRHIARLARLGIDEARLPALASELSGILEHMAELSRVDVGPPADATAPSGTPLRPDQGPPVPLYRTLAEFAPEVRDGFLIVPRLTTHGGSTADGRRARPDRGEA